MQHSRREFIQLMSLFTAGLPLAGFGACSPGGTVSDPWEALKMLKKAVLESSDNLPKRMADAIASKDPKIMFEFVRDAIQNYPNQISLRTDNGVGRQTNYRWGNAGCLRYGAGTFYEKANLLQSMLKEAGFEATVRHGSFDIEKTGWDRVFYGDYELPFDADFPKAIDKSSFRHRPLKTHKLDDERLENTTQEIMKRLPDDFKFPKINWEEITGKMDVVELNLDGNKIILNPNIYKGKFGESYLESLEGPSGMINRNSLIRIRLQLSSTLNPYDPETVAEAEYPLDAIFGRPVEIRFNSQLPLRQQLTLPRYMNHTFMPTISLLDVNQGEKPKIKEQFLGKSVHISGSTLEVKEKRLYVNDIPVEPGREHPDLRRQVSSLEIIAGTNNYPDVDLHIKPMRPDGKLQEGLEGPDFELWENDVQCPFQMHYQGRDRLKIFLLFDFSDSIPEAFRNNGATEFASTLMNEVHSTLPGTQFKAVTFTGLTVHIAPAWADTPEQLVQQIEQLPQSLTGSAIWNALSKASEKAGADLGVIVTDGHASDGRYNIDQKKKFRQGCPVVAIGVGDDPNLQCLADIGNLSKGLNQLVADHQKAIEFIADFVQEIKTNPYLLTFRSTDTGKKQHTLRLKLKNTSVEQKVIINIPQDVQTLTSSWVGMQLEIEYDGMRIKRRLAGISPIIQDPALNPLLPEHREETEAALFGSHTLCIEGSEPTTSALLLELIEAKFSQKKLLDAIQKGGEKDTIDALEAGFFTYPEDYLQLQHSFGTNSSKDHLIFQNGIRATLFHKYPNRTGTLVKAVDILPFSQWRTIHKNPKQGFILSLRHSLKLMNLEALNFQKATLNEISGLPLTWLNHDKVRPWIADIKDQALELKWQKAFHYSLGAPGQHFLIPEDKRQNAFYNLDTDSGTAFAQLMNGSGGGEQETRDRFAALDKALTVFSHVMECLGVGPAVGAWIALEKKKMEYLMIATIAIITMDADKTEEELNETLKRHLCNHFEDAAVGAAGSLGNIYAKVVDFWGVATGNSISVCG
ncbi:MAG: VWA domain-containing protein [Saprospiraceae bacterium]